MKKLYEVIPYSDKQRWENELCQFPMKDIFYFQAYSSLYLDTGDGEPNLFIYQNEGGNKIIYAYFKRPIHSLPFIDKDKNGKELYDIITPPYGYGGPLYSSLNKEEMVKFRRVFEDYCQKENIISEFIRFHPLYKNHELLNDSMDIFYDRETVYIDLRKSEEEFLKNYHKNHRRNLQKANKYDIQFKILRKEEASVRVQEFYDLYKETMDKLNASYYSYFSVQYMESLLTNMKNHSVIGTAYYNDKLVAAALCLYEGENIHYHLGCSKQEYLHLGINVFLFHNLSIWAKQEGFQLFHLGGGHVGRDSLFQFKHRFHQEGVLDFYIGKKIHNREIYNNLVLDWEDFYGTKLNSSFFPEYRTRPSDKVPVN